MGERFGLYLVLSNPVAGYEKCAEAAVAEGVRYLQLRMKGAAQQEVLAVARRLRTMTLGTATRFIVNDEVGVAIACDADGVHLGQTDASISDARRRWRTPGKVFGLSTHDETQARAAEAVHPSYIGIGPVFPTPTKQPPDPALGPERAANIARVSPLTTVAIGGIDTSNLPWVLAVGFTNFAVVRAVCGRSDPRTAISELQATWRKVARQAG
ncbi:MAG: thiamine phosphate synthase [Deltaproteobacteria bacterium HGW-Deltaproteobacteria-20]|jgi:thiamine-phosphate pyrophosphorylase|nr:MAG: thiamine phosphate synthase [Deltaproteobacteria bacterium HGW-Deltaproteobacteria-20]